jgi:uncharacterized protein (DUF1501 family)
MEPLSRLPRRDFLKLSSLAGLSWLTPLGQLLAEKAETEPGPAQSVILLWMAGGPSQLETFDPHPNTDSAAGTKALATNLKGVQLAAGLERTAEVMDSVSLVRSMVSKEGDHERGTHLMKTGYRPDPTAVHPSIGAICCHELPKGNTEIPRHISILPGRWPSRGGFLGDEYDAFKTGDPLQPLPDVIPQVPTTRDEQRAKDLEIVERAFARGRRVQGTLHQETVRNARLMMQSDQLKAFDVMREPLQVRREYGESPFGRACLAARRLIEVGVRCVEVTLDGWDSHVNNHSIHRAQLAILDPAFAALIRDLKRHDLLQKTVVMCAGEFGRTPKINPAGGRDHWPKGFSLAIAGGGIKPGRVVGATDPEGRQDPVAPVRVEDVHATVLAALGLNRLKENLSLAKRPIRLSQGVPVAELVE